MSSWSSWFLRYNRLSLVVLSSLLLSGAVGVLRSFGLLENLELWTYDRLIQTLSQSQSDPRLLLVAVDDPTLKKLNTDKVSDQDLQKALENLSKHQPSVIAVDILRDIPIGEGRENLINYLDRLYDPLGGKIKPIILTCQLPSAEQPLGIDPPPVLDPDSAIGFANLEVDPDDVIRRVPIASIPAPNSPENDAQIIQNLPSDQKQPQCLVPFSLGFLTAMRYLQEQNIIIQETKEKFFKLKNVVFVPPNRQAGSYQNLDAGSYQIILRYPLREPAEKVSFADVLDNKIPKEKIKDKVVLVGYTTKDDIHLTPYGMMPGVMIHAQVVNQVLAQVLDDKPGVWFWPEGVEWLWFTGWGIVGGLVAWRWRGQLLLYVIQSGTVLMLMATSVFFFSQGGWIPLIPPLFTFAGCSFIALNLPQAKRQKSIPSRAIPLGQASMQKTQIVGAYDPDDLDTVVESQTNPLPHTQPADAPPKKREFQRAPSTIGQLVGEGERYRIDQHLGGGGMGQVYLASDTKLSNRPVAIKVMTTYAVVDNDSLIERFRREVNLMASLNSLNIVTIRDFGLTPEVSSFRGSPFYVMEYLQGTTLTDQLEKLGRFSVEKALPIIRQICAGLREAHGLGIAHRDLKPDNIYLITHEALGEIVKILDFGIAKIINEASEAQNKPHLTATGSFIGTYRYASPEQCLGKSSIDHRTDIYSLGMIIYEMLSGTNPYNLHGEQNTQGYWASSHVHGKPTPLHDQPGCENIASELELVVMKCLEKEPQNRWHNIDELEKALIQAMSSVR